MSGIGIISSPRIDFKRSHISLNMLHGASLLCFLSSEWDPVKTPVNCGSFGSRFQDTRPKGDGLQPKSNGLMARGYPTESECSESVDLLMSPMVLQLQPSAEGRRGAPPQTQKSTGLI